KSYNSKVKKLIFNSNTLLLELIEKLTVCIHEEDKKTEYTLFHASVLKTALVATANTILPNVCRILYKYLTVKILKIQEDQIKQSLQYHATIIIPNKMQRYLLVIAPKFEIEQPMMINRDGQVLYLNALTQGSICEVQDINSKTIYERKLYREVWGKARAALMVAPSFDNESDMSSNDEGEVDSETVEKNLNPKELMNPYKCKGKDRPKGTDRIRRTNKAPKKAKRKLYCKICGGTGYNRATCS
ncbi:1329_t:CDS:2, partial [Racocetra fulgida]